MNGINYVDACVIGVGRLTSSIGLYFSIVFFIDFSKSMPRVEDWKVGEYLGRLRYSAQGYCIRGLIPRFRDVLWNRLPDFCLQRNRYVRYLELTIWVFHIRVVRFVKLFTFLSLSRFEFFTFSTRPRNFPGSQSPCNFFVRYRKIDPLKKFRKFFNSLM